MVFRYDDYEVMSAAVAVIEIGTDDEVTLLRRQLKEAYAVSRRLGVTLLGVKTDATEALGPVRLQRSERDLKEGLRLAQEQLDELGSILTRT
jgi:hypothetical protein